MFNHDLRLYLIFYSDLDRLHCPPLPYLPDESG